jgi:hypothetical protein
VTASGFTNASAALLLQVMQDCWHQAAAAAWLQEGKHDCLLRQKDCRTHACLEHIQSVRRAW